MRIFYPALLLLVLSGSLGCNIINPPEQVPTYVRIDSFSVYGDPLVTGSNSHKVTSVFVYLDNSPVGVFDLPANFPVIIDRPGTLSVLAGIDFDGLSGYQANYPLYTQDTMHLVPSPGQVQNFSPRVTYVPGTGLQSNEEFEQGAGASNSFVKLSGDTDLVNTVVPSEVFEGSGSGLISLGLKDSATFINRNGVNLVPNKSTYIELNYRSNVKVWIGMNVRTTSGSYYSEYIVGLNPRADWGKVYIGADDFIGPHQGSDFKLLLHVERPAGVSDGYCQFDNIKVINFKN